MNSNGNVFAAREFVVDRVKLRAWISEWHADRLLAEDDAGGNAHGSGKKKGARPERSFGAGGVYLLEPINELLASRPRYITILAMRGDKRFLVAPYGRLGVPAIPGEMSTGRKSIHLKVLCLWNARWMKMADLPKAWEAATLKKEEWRAAMDVYRAWVDNVPMPGKLSSRVGPALRHPLDPRHEYIAEESLWANRCLPGQPLQPEKAQGFQYMPAGIHELKMAAETRAQYRAGGKKRKRRTK